MVEQRHYDGADVRNKHTVEIDTGHAGHPEFVEEPAPYCRADDTEDNIQNDARPALIDQLAGYKAGE